MDSTTKFPHMYTYATIYNVSVIDEGSTPYRLTISWKQQSNYSIYVCYPTVNE